MTIKKRSPANRGRSHTSRLADESRHTSPWLTMQFEDAENSDDAKDGETNSEDTNEDKEATSEKSHLLPLRRKRLRR